MPVQKCTMRRKNERCATTQGLALAARWFGLDEAAVEAAVGRFTKGAQKGRLRGWIVWNECTVGGWCYPLQCVTRPGTKYGRFVKTYDELCAVMGLSTERFMAGAKRVDSAYGHNPLLVERLYPDSQEKAQRELNRATVRTFLADTKGNPAFADRGTKEQRNPIRTAVATASRAILKRGIAKA